jgi:hypothetical protein
MIKYIHPFKESYMIFDFSLSRKEYLVKWWAVLSRLFQSSISTEVCRQSGDSIKIILPEYEVELYPTGMFNLSFSTKDGRKTIRDNSIHIIDVDLLELFTEIYNESMEGELWARIMKTRKVNNGPE